MNNNFCAYSKYYDLLYKDKDYNSEVFYILNLISNYNLNAKSILELGSGTGIHGMLLKNHGYDVLGVELSKDMAEVAKNKGFECVVSDIVLFITEKRFDVVISLFHVISYITTNENLILLFNNANNHLNHNGIFIFDIWYSPAVYHQKPQLRLKKMEDSIIEITRIAKPVIEYNNNIVNVEFTVIVKDKINSQFDELFESHPMRHFSYNEILLLAHISGFEVLKCEEFLTGSELSEKTWGACFILKKIRK